MHESLRSSWIILYSDAWFGFVVLEGFFGGEEIAAGPTCYVLSTSKVNSENDKRSKAYSRHSLEAIRFGLYKRGGSKDGRPLHG